MWSVFALILVPLIPLVLAFMWYLRERYTVFTRMGINGPKPQFIFGNLLAYRTKVGLYYSKVEEDKIYKFCCLFLTSHEAFQDWTKEFGKVFGYYEGGTPILVTSDLDILQDIFVKQFSNFHARKLFPIQADPDKDKDVDMFSARGPRWKRLRTIINPTFTASKLKQMSTITNDAVDIMLEILAQKSTSGDSFDIYPVYQALTMDVIGRSAFGYVSDCQRNPDDEFLNLCREVMNNTVKMPWFAYATLFFPEIRRIGYLFAQSTTGVRYDAFGKLMRRIGSALEIWKEKKITADRVNLLQLLLNAESDDHQLENGGADAESDTLDWGTLKLDKKLLPAEVEKQIMLFMIAGFETTSTALAYATYLLAVNNDVQEKLQQEIDSAFPNQELPTLENTSKLNYLDMVVHEMLRLYPIATPVQARICMNACSVGAHGLHIPKGMTVAADVWTVHYDPEIWPDPEKFDPDRFLPENVAHRHPMAWLPFGAGPRNCIGMRFALMEIKIALVKILKKYSFKQCDKTQVPLRLKEGASTTPENGVIITMEERSVHN